jgi:hypothetical protein
MKMKRFFFILLFINPFSLFAQRVVTLSVNQPPELGFEVSSRQITITKGDSIILGKDLKITGGTGNYSFHWTPGSSLNDSTVMKPVAKPKISTNYFLTVTDKSGCCFSIDYNVTVNWVTPVPVLSASIDKDLSVVLFPNPNSGLFMVQLSGKPCPDISITVIDNLGRSIITKVIRNFSGEETVTLQVKLPAGIYTIRVTSATVIQRRFIII